MDMDVDVDVDVDVVGKAYELGMFGNKAIMSYTYSDLEPLVSS